MIPITHMQEAAQSSTLVVSLLLKNLDKGFAGNLNISKFIVANSLSLIAVLPQ